MPRFENTCFKSFTSRPYSKPKFVSHRGSPMGGLSFPVAEAEVVQVSRHLELQLLGRLPSPLHPKAIHLTPVFPHGCRTGGCLVPDLRCQIHRMGNISTKEKITIIVDGRGMPQG